MNSYFGLLYSSKDNINDIGLVETGTIIPFNAHVGPAHLPFSVDNRPCIGQSIIAVGKLIILQSHNILKDFQENG